MRGWEAETGVTVEIVIIRLVADDQAMGRAGSSCQTRCHKQERQKLEGNVILTQVHLVSKRDMIF